MAGDDFVFNVAKGRQAHYASLPDANDALVLVMLQATGLAGDATLRDFDTLAAILAGTSDEATAAGYAREVLAGVTVTVNDTDDRVDIDCADAPLGVVGTAGSPQTMGKALICYDPDTTAGDDTTIVPISAHSYDTVFDGSDITVTMPAAGPFFDG